MRNLQYSFRFKIDNNFFEVDVSNSCFSKTLTQNYSFQSMHYHRFIELFFVIDGNVTIVTETGEVSTNNGIVVVPPFLTHYSKRSGEIFNFTFLIKNSEKNGTFYSLFNSTNIFTLQKNENVLKYISILKDAFLIENNFVLEKVELLFKLLFWEILLANDSCNKNSTVNSATYTSEIENFIFNNYNKDVTLKDFAKHLSLSTRQTSRIIKQNYDKSFSLLLNERRLYIASKLLLNSNKSMAEIAEAVCFNTENYFYSQFKKHYGLTPLQYKKKYVNTIK